MAKALILCAALWTSAVAVGAAEAQTLQTPPAASPIRQTVDANGVDLVTGAFTLGLPNIVAIGKPGQSGLALSQSYVSSSGWTFGFIGQVNVSGSTYTVSLGGGAEYFTYDGSVFTNAEGTGSTLSYDGSRYYTYTLRDGTQVIYDTTITNGSGILGSNNQVHSIVKPNYETLTFNYSSAPYCYMEGAPPACVTMYLNRLQSITSNLGYQLQFFYSFNGAPSSSQAGAFYTVTSVTAFNLATDYCDPRASSCSFSQTSPPWPTVTYDSGFRPTSITDPAGRLTTIAYDTTTGNVSTITKSSGTTMTIGYNGSSQVASVTLSNPNNPSLSETWTYSYSTSGGNTTTTVQDPLGETRTVVSNSSTDEVSTDTLVMSSSVSRTTIYGYDNYGRMNKVTLPQGGYTQIAYDGRGNVTSTTKVSATPGTPANIVVSATYPSDCPSAKTCNQPTTVTDANGNQTSYTYDDATGHVLTVTSPAVNGVSPQTTYTYNSLYAWYQSGPGVIAQDPVSNTAVSVLKTVSACQTTSSCSGTSDQTLTSIGYVTGSSSTATNLLPAGASTGAGDGSLTATTVLSYDVFGNVSAVQGPLGSAQTTDYWYNADRQLVGAVGPNPGTTGALNRAVLITYNSDGLIWKTQQGTESGYTNPASSGFTSLQELTTTYDSLDRKAQDTVTSNNFTATWSVAQYGYDAANRLQCTAARMNPAAFSSLPSSACTLGTAGSHGNDRITYQSYDAASEVTHVVTGYGDSTQRNYVTTAYNIDGLVSSVTDANGKVSTYGYDGMDRLVSLTYPDSTYQGYSYDPNSNVTQLRQRNGQTIGFTYDALNRRATKTPAESANAVTYAYDNLGRLKSAATSSQTVSYTYDALGRQLTEAQPLGTMASAYDIAGRRTQLTWPDSFYVKYDYDELGELLDARENGATSGVGVLASYTYDNLGRRTTVTRGDGVSTSYGFDANSDLTSLAYSGSSNNPSFSYGYDALGEIVSRTNSNAAYAWNGATSLNQAYGVNNLNQYTSVGGTAYGYDSNGNLASGATQTYTFDSQTRLATASGSPSATLSYDPTDRLFQTSASSTTQFLYDGPHIVAEYGSGAVQRRYVDGPGADEPIVWYTGSGTSSRAWLLQDERGSVLAGADSSGNVSWTNSYDEYGQPGSSNTGRFQYTGQAWIPEAGAYDYKARVYLPSIGRFLQSDPMGYAAGMNIYAYGDDNPIDKFDPSGLAGCPDDSTDVVVCGGGGGGGVPGGGGFGNGGTSAPSGNPYGGPPPTNIQGWAQASAGDCSGLPQSPPKMVTIKTPLGSVQMPEPDPSSPVTFTAIDAGTAATSFGVSGAIGVATYGATNGGYYSFPFAVGGGTAGEGAGIVLGGGAAQNMNVFLGNSGGSGITVMKGLGFTILASANKNGVSGMAGIGFGNGKFISSTYAIPLAPPVPVASPMYNPMVSPENMFDPSSAAVMSAMTCAAAQKVGNG